MCPVAGPHNILQKPHCSQLQWRQHMVFFVLKVIKVCCMQVKWQLSFTELNIIVRCFRCNRKIWWIILILPCEVVKTDQQRCSYKFPFYVCESPNPPFQLTKLYSIKIKNNFKKQWKPEKCPRLGFKHCNIYSSNAVQHSQWKEPEKAAHSC